MEVKEKGTSMELTPQEKQITIAILSNANLPVKEAPVVIAIINKLAASMNDEIIT